MIGTLEIEQMNCTEKLQAMELLWHSMATAPANLESPDGQKILAQHLAKVKAGKGKFFTLSQLRKCLAKNL